MRTRRQFLERIAAASAALAQPALVRGETPEKMSISDERAWWVATLTRVAEPVLANLAANQLKARMPVEGPKAAERRNVTHLEALGRTLSGVAPWLVVAGAAETEEKRRANLATLARRGIANALDPSAADHLNFTAGAQNLVDAAFLALGLARGRTELWDKLDETTRTRLAAALQSTRKFKPGRNNWLLFSATIEAFLASAGEDWMPEPIDIAIKEHESWYKGDGTYGDGPEFHWDYYNSYVIQPMLLEVLELIAPISNRWAGMRDNVMKRARRYAAVQERLIAPDGSFPPLGRSMVYRCGAFHHLAAMAFRRDLPGNVPYKSAAL
jgi:hypothetical protein